MYLLEKKHVNDYVFFVIRNEKNFKIVDYFIFSPINYYSIFEEYIYNIFKEILEFNFKEKKYTNSKFLKFLMTYKIDIKNKKIYFKNSYFFNEVILYMDQQLNNLKKYLENKKTKVGIESFYETNLPIAFQLLEKSTDENVLKFFEFFQLEKKTELIAQLFSLYFAEEYEVAISNTLEMAHKKNKAIQEYNHIANKLKYFAKGD